jgi:pimeloyl-ACP methyl ester carboxylesterase
MLATYRIPDAAMNGLRIESLSVDIPGKPDHDLDVHVQVWSPNDARKDGMDLVYLHGLGGLAFLPPDLEERDPENLQQAIRTIFESTSARRLITMHRPHCGLPPYRSSANVLPDDMPERTIRRISEEMRDVIVQLGVREYVAMGYSFGGPIAGYTATLDGPVQRGAVLIDATPPDVSRTYILEKDADTIAQLKAEPPPQEDPEDPLHMEVVARLTALQTQQPWAQEQTDFAPDGPGNPTAQRILGRPAIPTSLIIATKSINYRLPTLRSHQLHWLHGVPPGESSLEYVATDHSVARVKEGCAAIIRSTCNVLRCIDESKRA